MTDPLNTPLMARVIERALRVAEKGPSELVTALATEVHLICETANFLDALASRCEGPSAPGSVCVWCEVWRQLDEVSGHPERYSQAQHELALHYARRALDVRAH